MHSRLPAFASDSRVRCEMCEWVHGMRVTRAENVSENSGLTFRGQSQWESGDCRSLSGYTSSHRQASRSNVREACECLQANPESDRQSPGSNTLPLIFFPGQTPLFSLILLSTLTSGSFFPDQEHLYMGTCCKFLWCIIQFLWGTKKNILSILCVSCISSIFSSAYNVQLSSSLTIIFT